MQLKIVFQRKAFTEPGNLRYNGQHTSRVVFISLHTKITDKN